MLVCNKKSSGVPPLGTSGLPSCADNRGGSAADRAHPARVHPDRQSSRSGKWRLAGV